VVLRSQTDERLSGLASAGNQQAFTAIYERYRRELGSHARRIVRPDRADDVVQHAMLAAWSALLAGAEISDLRAWLHRVVHNSALDTVSRRGYNDGDIPDSSIAPARTEELAEGRLSAASALAAIAALPESQRRALTLTAIEGRSGHDAALELGISESAIRQLVYRARSGVRGAVTAVIPLQLINWLVAAAGAPATPTAVVLGVAGGGAATVAKVVAVISVTAATVGATQALEGHHQRGHTHVATSQAATPTTERGGHASGLGVAQASVNELPTSATNNAAGQLAGEQRRNGGQIGSSQQDPSNNADHQAGSQRTTGSTGNQQSGTQDQSGAAQQHTTSTPSGTNYGSQPDQGGQGNGGTSSAPQNGQSSNGN
jgi:RNA polymerase sigma factor (sigma-70 family)